MRGQVLLKWRGASRSIIRRVDAYATGRLAPFRYFFSAANPPHSVLTQSKIMLRILIGISLLLMCSQVVLGQRVGDRVMVTQAFETRLGNEKVDKVLRGQIGTVVDINGQWCSLRGIKGWLPAQYAMNLDTALKYYDERLQANAQDAEGWTTRGMLHYELGKLDEAFQDFNERFGLTIACTSPGTTEAWFQWRKGNGTTRCARSIMQSS